MGRKHASHGNGEVLLVVAPAGGAVVELDAGPQPQLLERVHVALGLARLQAELGQQVAAAAVEFWVRRRRRVTQASSTVLATPAVSNKIIFC